MLLGDGFDAEPVAAEGGAHRADDAYAGLGAAGTKAPEFEGAIAVEDGQGGGAAPGCCRDAGRGPYACDRCVAVGRLGVLGGEGHAGPAVQSVRRSRIQSATGLTPPSSLRQVKATGRSPRWAFASWAMAPRSEPT